jgi:hypothetical protein
MKRRKVKNLVLLSFKAYENKVRKFFYTLKSAAKDLLVVVPSRRRFGHVDVVCGSNCSQVWVGRGDKGTVGVRQGVTMGQTLSPGHAFNIMYMLHIQLIGNKEGS